MAWLGHNGLIWFDVHPESLSIYYMTIYIDSFPDAYDAITVAGGMGEGHIPCSALVEMARIVKPGKSHDAYLLYLPDSCIYLHCASIYLDTLTDFGLVTQYGGEALGKGRHWFM